MADKKIILFRIANLWEIIGVGGWQRGAVQNGVIFTHTVVLGGAVLEVATVAVGFNLLPARSHEGSANGVVR